MLFLFSYLNLIEKEYPSILRLSIEYLLHFLKRNPFWREDESENRRPRIVGTPREREDKVMRMCLNRILGIIYPGDHLPSYMIDLRPRLV